MADGAGQQFMISSSREPRLPRQRLLWRSMAIWLTAIFLVETLASGMTWPALLQRFQARTSGPSFSMRQARGQAFFVSSGLLGSLNSSQGTTDELQINLQSIPNPHPGESYYAWLMDNNNQSSIATIFLGTIVVDHGQVNFSFQGTAPHDNLLANYSRFLITEEATNITPSHPSPDKSNWRYYAEFSQKPGLQDPQKYSLYDHIRHLLAADPKLKDVGLNGGLDIWLFRNTEKIVEWSGSARDAWGSKSAASADLIRRQLSRILAYLDGTIYYHIELPRESLRVDPTIAKVALLEFDVEKQDPPGYLYHIGTRHLHAVTQLPDASADQKALAVQISKAIDNVNVWLQTVHNDALKLFKMTDGQLFGDDGRVLLDELATQANYAFVGQINPYTNQVKEGVVQVHYNIQRLATFEIRECTSSHPCAL
jgi:eukaryotic-like serine/threonine-protein kinase